MRPERLYYALEFFSSVALSASWLALSVYMIQVVRLTPFELVLVGTALEVSIFLLEVPTGIVADLYSRKRSVLLGVLCLGIGTFFSGLSTAFAPIALLQIVKGAGYAFISGAQAAWLTDEIGEEAANKAFLRASQYGAIAGPIGTILAIVLGSVSLPVPILFGGGLLIGLAAILTVIMPETGFKPHPHDGTSALTRMFRVLGEGFRIVRGRPSLRTLVMVTGINGAFSESYDRINEYLWVAVIGIPAGISPLLWLGGIGIATTPISLIITELTRRWANLEEPAALARLLFWLNAGLMVAVIGFALAGNAWVALPAFIAVGQIRRLLHPLYQAWLNRDLEPASRATVFSMVSQTDALGEMVGGPVLGAFGNASARGAIVIGALLLSPALWLFGRRSRG